VRAGFCPAETGLRAGFAPLARALWARLRPADAGLRLAPKGTACVMKGAPEVLVHEKGGLLGPPFITHALERT
jgi:hypothetical protein